MYELGIQQKNDGKGYATGIDVKINGDFVKGYFFGYENCRRFAQRYLCKQRYGQTIYPEYIRRPSDQRFNFSLMFQDYLANNPSFKVNLNLLYGSGLPFNPRAPKDTRHRAILLKMYG